MTWGINPGQSVYVDERLPRPADLEPAERRIVAEALDFMGFRGGEPIKGTRIDVAFVGSCTNARLSDLREAARVVRGPTSRRTSRRWSCPDRRPSAPRPSAKGSTACSREAGFEWRGAGCSMCLAMNPDRLEGREICASSSNRNFKGRQGSPTGRTLLMSPAMVAAAAIAGEVVDVQGDVSDGD